MPRRQIANKRSDFKDPKYNDELVAKFINRMMLHGKKSISISILYDAIEIANKKAEKEGLEVFSKALANVKPSFEVKSRRVGGSTYQVPVDVRESRGESLAMRWLISAARSKSGKSMSQRLSSELLDAFNSTGSAFKKKEDTHRMADSNKAFAHYKW